MSNPHRWAALWFGAGALSACCSQAFHDSRLPRLPPAPAHPPVPFRSKTPKWVRFHQPTGDCFDSETIMRCDGCRCYFSLLTLTKVLDSGDSRWLCPDCMTGLQAETEARHGANVRMVVGKKP